MNRLEDWWTQLVAVFRETVADVVTYLPVLVTSLSVLLLGWLVAIVVRLLVRRALRSEEHTSEL